MTKKGVVIVVMIGFVLGVGFIYIATRYNIQIAIQPKESAKDCGIGPC